MKKYRILIAGMFVAAAYLWIAVLGNDPLQPFIAGKILRFHVIANSDSAEDQRVKEAVRDAVGAYVEPLLKETKSLAETKAVVEKAMDEIVAIAEETLRENGFDNSVRAEVAATEFPEKTYGTFTFPKGRYEALRITIGEGRGQNWWCVLYPNLCFRGSVYEVVDAEAGRLLREVLSPWEYADVFTSGKVEVRWKFLEYFFGNE